MAESFYRFDEDQLDVFTEIGNIGAGNAATALSRILDRKIDMTVPAAQVVPFDEITNILDGPETVVAGVLVAMTGDLNGYILLLMRVQDAAEMMSMIIPEELRSGDCTGFGFNEVEQSSVLEVSNILVGSFISAISTFTSLTIIPSAPLMAIDMLGAIMSIAAIEYGKMGDSVLFLKTAFFDIEESVSGHFFLIPDYDSYKILLESLGMG